MWFRKIASQKNETKREQEENYLAKLEIYNSMAHYVGKVLHIRPSVILDTWGCAELLVAYGEYANEQTQKIYEEWKTLNAKHRGKQPAQYQVKFIGD